jgi:hypothetical protein
MVEKLHKKNELDERCLPIRPDRCLMIGERSDDDDETETTPIEIINKQVFIFSSHSDTDLFLLLNRMLTFLLRILVCQFIGIYTEFICRITMMILVLLFLVNLRR